jgi:hypothetical protein
VAEVAEEAAAVTNATQPLRKVGINRRRQKAQGGVLGRQIDGKWVKRKPQISVL